MYILTVALFVDSKNRTVTRFQTESGMAAIKGAGIAVLTIDTYKIFTVRAILQGTGSTPLMIIVRGGFDAVAGTLRFITGGILCIGENRQQGDEGIEKDSFHYDINKR